jgi:hypothetical protein
LLTPSYGPDISGVNAKVEDRDEYAEPGVLCDFIKEYEVRTVFTRFSPEDHEKIYSKEKVDLNQFFTVLSGHNDEETAKQLN